jgi:hypothetical protein
MRAALACIACVVACHREPALVPGSAEQLAKYLEGVAGADEATRRRAVDSWKLDEPTFRRTVVDPYQALWGDYVVAFERAAPQLVAQLAARGPIAVRRHYAGDPKLSLSQARNRWAVRVQYPSMVAEIGGAPIDTVFAYEGGAWHVLAGLDDVMLAHVRDRDDACARRLETAGPTGRCTEVGWMIADAALRNQPERFTHACALAVTLCGNGSP